MTKLRTDEELKESFLSKFDNPLKINENPPSAYEIADWWLSLRKEDMRVVREETLKELIREFQVNELDGKGYDFYFAIRTKIDELSALSSLEREGE